MISKEMIYQPIRSVLQELYHAAASALALVEDPDDRAVITAIKDQASDQIDKINTAEST